MPKPVPGEVVVVPEVPQCNFCEKPGPYDFKTEMGPWANACEQHWRMYRATPGLGVGIGQLWITKDQVTEK